MNTFQTAFYDSLVSAKLTNLPKRLFINDAPTKA